MAPTRPRSALTPRPMPPAGRRTSLQRCRRASRFATVVVTDPPAFCTASIAAADAPETVMVIARLISPFASSRTPCSLPRTRPAARSVVLVDRLAGVQLAGGDRRLQRAEVHRRVLLAERIVEAALRQPAIDRHLTALEAVQRHACARLLALHALAGGLALARADAAPEPLGLQARAGIVAQFVELHVRTAPPP